MNPLVDTAYIGDIDARARVEGYLSNARSGSRVNSERYWRVNLLAYSGEPYFRVGESGRFEEIDPTYRDRYVYVNLAFNIVEVLAGRMSYDPKVEASAAAASDIEDSYRARAAADLGNHCVRAAEVSEAFTQVMKLIHICGLAWMKTGWDPMRGRRVAKWEAQPCPACGGSGAIQSPTGGMAPCPACAAEGDLPLPQGHQAPPPGQILNVVGDEPEGDVFCEAVPPWEIWPDPEARTLADCRKLVHEKEISRTEAWENWGKYAGISEEDFQRTGDDPETIFSVRTADGWQRPSRREYVRIREYWELPSEKYPQGLYVVICGGDILRAGPLPYAHGKLPFVPFTCYPIPGALYPKSTLDMVMPLIHTTNDHLSNINARAYQSVHMRILAPRGSAIRLDDEPGVVYYRPVPGQQPKELNIGPPPSDAAQIIQYLSGYIKDVSGSVDVMKGDPGDATSARMAAWFEDQAMSRLKPMMDSHARALELVIRLLIDTAKLFYGEARIIRVYGAAVGATETRLFSPESFGDSDDVILRSVRDMGRSRSVRLQELQEALQLQVITPDEYRDLSDLANDGSMYEWRRMHESAAVMENQLLRAGQQIAFPQQYEDHGIHIKTHVRLLTELRVNDQANPLIAWLTDHIAKHEEAQAYDQVRQQMLQQQAMAGYGAANAANPATQPQAAQAGAAAAGTAPPTNPGLPGAPETQPSLSAADQNVKQYG